MAERTAAQAQRQQAEVDQYVRSIAGHGGGAAEIDKAKRVLDDGTLTQAEFDALKAKALAA